MDHTNIDVSGCAGVFTPSEHPVTISQALLEMSLVQVTIAVPVQ